MLFFIFSLLNFHRKNNRGWKVDHYEKFSNVLIDSMEEMNVENFLGKYFFLIKPSNMRVRKIILTTGKSLFGPNRMRCSKIIISSITHDDKNEVVQMDLFPLSKGSREIFNFR